MPSLEKSLQPERTGEVQRERSSSTDGRPCRPPCAHREKRPHGHASGRRLGRLPRAGDDGSGAHRIHPRRMPDCDGDGRPAAQPHIAPEPAELDGATPRLVVYEDAMSRQDLARDSPVTFTTWKEGAVAIFYGRVREVLGRLRSTCRHARRSFPPPSRLTGSGATGRRSRPPYTSAAWRRCRTS